MGRGDKRSRRGKIAVGSYGKTRPKRKKKHTSGTDVNNEAEPKKTSRKKKTE